MNSGKNSNGWPSVKAVNWLAQLVSTFSIYPLKHYSPLVKEDNSELAGYHGKYSKQSDYLYFKSLMES